MRRKKVEEGKRDGTPRKHNNITKKEQNRANYKKKSEQRPPIVGDSITDDTRRDATYREEGR
jgi:hypothetical protein